MRRLATATTTAALAAALLAAPGAAVPAQADDTGIPVVLIHGRSANAGVWGSLKDRLVRSGFPEDRIHTWEYDTSKSTNEVLAGQLAAYVNSLGVPRVNIVAHSLGSLPSRWYIKFGGGGQNVDQWISLAGPNHGTSLAYACALWDQGCKDMTPGSWVVSHLNEGDPTPGSTRYTTFWSPNDEQILPQTSTQLTGATNIKTDGLKHNDFLSNPTVLNQLDALLTR
ncbi:esterase/lipase family protein [Streptomyces sp. NPDC050145]|uniref:esterase/lipase family protein n=1 Tax=Streptomyces sp. NPDC050145 TaxID=3365602 RepID=UPI0037AAF2BB